ncbi:MAG: iron chaperone [Chloroflexota bacterium]
MENTKPTSIDQYISSFPVDVQAKLRVILELVRKLAPDAEESISYQMPAFKLNGRPLVYFAAFKNHIGFYPTPSGITQFEEELSKFKKAKGSAQFPLNEPLPVELIEKIIRFRMKDIT